MTSLCRLSLIIFIAAGFIVSAPLSYGADFYSKLHPHITISEQYNDNVYLTKTDKKEDFITTVSPGIRFANMDNKSGIELDYTLNAVFYAKESDRNYIGHNALFSSKYMTPSHVNFYLRDLFIRSEDSREQEYFTKLAENRYLLTTDRTRAVYMRNVLEPTIEYMFGPESRVGVMYRNNIYDTKAAGYYDSQENYVSPFFTYWFNRQNGISVEYGYTIGEFDDPAQSDLTGHSVKGRYTYRPSPKTSYFAEYSYAKRLFDLSQLDYEVNQPSLGVIYSFTPALVGSLQLGYYWMEPKIGDRKDGFSYTGSLTTTDPESRTTVSVSLQGGYTEDFFTAENAGFTKYHRLTGSLSNRPDKRTTVGVFGSVERADYIRQNRTDDIWGAGVRASYMVLKWLTVSADYAHRELKSDNSLFDYKENVATVQLTAAY